MLGKAHDEFSQLLLALYRLSLECPLHQFQDEALRLVRGSLAFDSSMWGTATQAAAGIDIHTIHLHNQPAEMLAAYEAIKHLDTAAAEVARYTTVTLSFHTASCFSARSQRALIDYGKRFEQQNFFISSTQNRESGFTHWVSLFRASPDAHGTEQERLLLAAVAPHLQQALEHNRIVHLGRLHHQPAPLTGSAIADTRGRLHHADPAFCEALRAEWAHWTPPTLPDAVVRHFASGQHRFRGRHRVVSCHAERGLLFLHARPHHRADELTPRELAVARLMAKGDTHKQVAAALGRAPATVRNHMQAIYGKLEVNSIAALIEELRRVDA